MKYILFAVLLFASINVNAAVSRPTINTPESFQDAFSSAREDTLLCDTLMTAYAADSAPTAEKTHSVDYVCGRMFFALSLLIDAPTPLALTVIDTQEEVDQFTKTVNTLERLKAFVNVYGIDKFPILNRVALDVVQSRSPTI